VVTEEVQQTVPVQREEVRVEREPITDANVGAATDGPEISEEEHEVTLHAEEPVCEKRTVPEGAREPGEGHGPGGAPGVRHVAKEQIEVDGADERRS
jgi:hypothetical protein